MANIGKITATFNFFESTCRRVNMAWFDKYAANHEACYMGTVGPYQFYDHLTRGDEANLIAIRDGKGWHSCWNEIPDLHEIMDQ